jgi:hypothetical protein
MFRGHLPYFKLLLRHTIQTFRDDGFRLIQGCVTDINDIYSITSSRSYLKF